MVALSFATYGRQPDPNIAAGMLCVVLLFTAVVSIPRTFLIEDEQGTFDTIRIVGDPGAIYFGKVLYCAALSLVSSVILSGLFVVLTITSIKNPLLFGMGLFMNSLALCAGVSFCAALVIGANNKWILGSAISLPVLLPLIFLCMGSFRVAFGVGGTVGGWQCVFGLFGWALTLWAAGPQIIAATWNTRV